ncbi:hypothetical protein EVAR_5962_1 [Eumeta japonica]|uniref:Uncharacterized protein n=1 Tax=Eumeta variegata TaxID=151549 RepID=A0A4C1TFF8_EUMVA|nr:hypothetical protein EVAR_5962_1 [Eumeta japonica]
MSYEPEGPDLDPVPQRAPQVIGCEHYHCIAEDANTVFGDIGLKTGMGYVSSLRPILGGEFALSQMIPTPALTPLPP